MKTSYLCALIACIVLPTCNTQFKARTVQDIVANAIAQKLPSVQGRRHHELTTEEKDGLSGAHLKEATDAINKLVDESIVDRVQEAEKEVSQLLLRSIEHHIQDAGKVLLRHDENPCADRITSCNFLQEAGVCKTSRDAMVINCPKTCDFCGVLDALKEERKETTSKVSTAEPTKQIIKKKRKSRPVKANKQQNFRHHKKHDLHRVPSDRQPEEVRLMHENVMDQASDTGYVPQATARDRSKQQVTKKQNQRVSTSHQQESFKDEEQEREDEEEGLEGAKDEADEDRQEEEKERLLEEEEEAARAAAAKAAEEAREQEEEREREVKAVRKAQARIRAREQAEAMHKEKPMATPVSHAVVSASHPVQPSQVKEAGKTATHSDDKGTVQVKENGKDMAHTDDNYFATHCHPMCAKDCIDSCAPGCCVRKNKDRCHPMCIRVCLPSCGQGCCAQGVQQPLAQQEGMCPPGCPASCAPFCTDGCCFGIEPPPAIALPAPTQVQLYPPQPPPAMWMTPPAAFALTPDAAAICIGGCIASCDFSCPSSCCPQGAAYQGASAASMQASRPPVKTLRCPSPCPQACAPGCTPNCCEGLMGSPQLSIFRPRPPQPPPSPTYLAPPPALPLPGPIPAPFDTCPGTCPSTCAPGCDFDCCRPYLDPLIIQAMQQELLPLPEIAVPLPQPPPLPSPEITKVIHIQHVYTPQQAIFPPVSQMAASCPLECQRYCGPACVRDGCCISRKKRKRNELPRNPASKKSDAAQ